ncbi:MAG: hypothetical protein ACYC25_11035 [Paludibacter sp.]
MESIQPDTSYHIFNHANGFENIFRHEANYYFFLEKYLKYIGPIAETYAWCLMPNHFHLVVRIRKRAILINNYNFSKVSGFENSGNKAQSTYNQTDSQNFGKVVGLENSGTKAQSNFNQTDSQNFGKVSGFENSGNKAQSTYNQTDSQNFGKVVGLENSGTKAQSNFNQTDSQNFGKVSGFENSGNKAQSTYNQPDSQNSGKVVGFENSGNKVQSTYNQPDSKNSGNVVGFENGGEEEQNFSKVIGIEDRSDLNPWIYEEANSRNFGKVSGGVSGGVSDRDIEKYLSKQFANLFSCYTQSFNKVYGRMGSLFVKNFKREPISDRNHFLNAVAYTHRNPVHHGFCKQMDDWPYSSYNEFINRNNSGIENVKLLKMVGGLEGFLEIHQRAVEKIDTSTFPDIPLLI